MSALLFMLAGSLGGRAQAPKVHPVRIAMDQPATAEACLQCHQGIRKAYTHAPVEAMGCVGCHEIQTEANRTVITLTERGNQLCFTCHSDKDAKQAQGRVHGPVAEGECVTCHSPHASDNKFLLLQPASGGHGENLCLMCHDIGESVPVGGSRHPALDLGCDSCHVTHKSGLPGTPEYFHLTQSGSSLCLTCHDATDKTLSAAHQGQPFAESNCLACHEPHASPNPKLTHRYVHLPFAERQCDACHEAPQGGKVQLIAGGTRDLCFACHDNVQAQLASAKHKHSVFEVTDTCTVCHSPHATPNPKQLIASAVTLCETCHTDRAEERATMRFLHRPVFQDGCTVCHQPHAAETPGNLRAGVDELCLSCHARDAWGEPGSDANALILFGGSVSLPGDYLQRTRRIPVGRGAVAGHPVASHPVSGRPDPSNPGKTISCVSCHNPHASSNSPKFFVSGTKSSSPLCLRCHQ